LAQRLFAGIDNGNAMHKLTDSEQAQLLEILRQYEQELRAFRGVHYVDVGFRFKDGRPTDELAIRVHVHEKKPESELDPDQILPKHVGGLAVDVIQSSPGLELNPRDRRFDPLVGGVAVKNTRHAFFGTLGVVVFDQVSGAPMGLSNHHVLVGSGGRPGDNIAQPASNNPQDVIGTLTRWNIGLDCAVCTLNTSRQISIGIVDYPAGLRAPGMPTIGMAVSKSGRTTQTTFGIVDGVSGAEFTIVPDPANPPPNGEISMGGDSGSVWLEPATFNAIGLHYAGETNPDPNAERAWAKRITNVLTTLNVRLTRV
jgi:hypothetical protein